MKFFKKMLGNDDPNTGRLSLIACMCLLLFIWGVGFVSEYSAGSLSSDAHYMKDIVSGTETTTHPTKCDKQSLSKVGDPVPVSCVADPTVIGGTPL